MDVQQCVPPGAVVGLVGPNGSGKSTLLGVAAGLIPADAGSAFVAGAPAGSLDAARATAFVPDEPAGLDELTVHELLSLLAVLHGSGPAVARRRARLGEAFDLTPLLDRRLGELSRGQRRRTSLVAALQLDAQLILVDEAIATLDAPSVGALGEALTRAAARGAGVLLATHDRAFLDGFADELIELSGGTVSVTASEGCHELAAV